MVHVVAIETGADFSVKYDFDTEISARRVTEALKYLGLETPVTEKSIELSHQILHTLQLYASEGRQSVSLIRGDNPLVTRIGLISDSIPRVPTDIEGDIALATGEIVEAMGNCEMMVRDSVDSTLYYFKDEDGARDFSKHLSTLSIHKPVLQMPPTETQSLVFAIELSDFDFKTIGHFQAENKTPFSDRLKQKHLLGIESRPKPETLHFEPPTQSTLQLKALLRALPKD